MGGCGFGLGMLRIFLLMSWCSMLVILRLRCMLFG